MALKWICRKEARGRIEEKSSWSIVFSDKTHLISADYQISLKYYAWELQTSTTLQGLNQGFSPPLVLASWLLLHSNTTLSRVQTRGCRL